MQIKIISVMLIRHLLNKFNKAEKSEIPQEQGVVPFVVGQKDKQIEKQLTQSAKTFKQFLSESEDLIEKQVQLCVNGTMCSVMFIDGLVDNNMVSDTILRSLVEVCVEKGLQGKQLVEHIEKQVLVANEVEIASSHKQMAQACLKGDTVVFVDGAESGLIINTKGGERRSITEPTGEAVVRGPREGFTENLRVNVALIRRKIKNGNLKVEQMTIGKKTQTVVSIIYLNQVVKPQLVEQLKKRLQNLNVESVLESGYIEQYIEDHPLSPFSTINYTEKPDIAAAKILEGRVAIIVDGTPFVLTVPMLFIESFQASEDYYVRPFYASFIRIFRYFAFLISIFGPAIYVALANFHQELIPTTLLLRIITAKEGTPFPIFIETLFMVMAFEFLREAGIRLPRSVGQAVSIVGALIMGEAAVSAGIVGAPIVIVVAFTAVCSFIMPQQNNSSTIWRLIMLAAAAFAGLFGVMMGLLAMLYHLASLESFGVPYFDSFSNANDLKDIFVRIPLWLNRSRPRFLADKDKKRTEIFVPPNTQKVYIPENDDEEI
jgi:spore germination protein KA